jgi:hypothetical protein
VTGSARRLSGIGAVLIAMALVWAASAYAGRSTYISSSDPGVDFVLAGRGCPGAQNCFDHARITEFSGFWEQFPNCPEVNLSGGFTYGPYGGRPRSVHVKPDGTFRGHGPSTDYGGDTVTFAGHFLRSNPRRAKGWFKMTESNGGETCKTGVVRWSARVSN